MSYFKITHKTLTDLCGVNQFKIPDTDLIFFGVRGSITGNPNNHSFGIDQNLNLMDVNYINPRCTIMQWDLKAKKIAAFPASTVPHINNVKTALSKNGIGANSLMTGFYNDYRKGWHKAGSPTGHEAFRQNAIHPIRRTSDDLDYDKDDRIEYDNPQDNIHCGWFQGMDATTFASAGCQVIMGYPKCSRPGRDKNIGPWSIFHANTYKLTQNAFPYILLGGTEVFQLATGNKPKNFKLRFGSAGPLVGKLQEALKKKKIYEGIIDNDFGPRTIKALISFQQQAFGNDGADGVLGPITAEELGIKIKYVQ